MKWVIGIVIGIAIGAGGTLFFLHRTTPVVSPIIQAIARPLDRYTIPNLKKTSFAPSQIIFDPPTSTTSAYTVVPFRYLVEGKKVTGVAHVPNSPKPTNGYPVIVQFRGYVDADKYYAGEGTEHSAESFAANGFLSLAPDFLGYGASDKPSTDVFEERFQTYTTALTLLSSVKTLSIADPARVGVWGHSNGGQIALTVLEAAPKPYPASLWAPVSKPFPYSILYYTDEADDQGKALRRELAKFEDIYDVNPYALTNYLDFISGPLQIHQGTADAEVPLKWTDDFVHVLQDKKVKVEYFTYPGADHNLTPGWNTVIARDIAFFSKQLK